MANTVVVKEFVDKVMAFDAEKKELAEAEKEAARERRRPWPVPDRY